MKRFVCIVLCAVLAFGLCGCRRYKEVFSSSGFVSDLIIPSVTSSEQNSISSDPSDIALNSSGGQPSSQDGGAGTSSTAETPSLPGSQGSNPQAGQTSSNPSVSHRPAVNGVYSTYQELTAQQKAIYNIIKDTVAKMNEGMVPLGKHNPRDVAVAFGAVRTDYPEYFWMPNTYVTQTQGNNISIAFQSREHGVSYKCSRAERFAMQERMNARMAEVRAAVEGAKTDYEIELALHDWLCSNIDYDGKDEPGTLSYTAYGALVEGLAVCEGYARAMQWLCKQYSIPCTLVCGEAGGVGHMWNMIYIGNEWYHLDVTWDDYTEKNGVILHGYFNLSSTRISRSHKIDKHFSKLSDEDLLVDGIGYNIIDTNCSSERYFYGKLNNIVLNDSFTASHNTIVSKLTEVGNKGGNFCEFYIDSDDRSNIEIKYSLQKCFYDVKLNNGKNIKGYSLILTGSATAMGIILNFEGE